MLYKNFESVRGIAVQVGVSLTTKKRARNGELQRLDMPSIENGFAFQIASRSFRWNRFYFLTENEIFCRPSVMKVRFGL